VKKQKAVYLNYTFIGGERRRVLHPEVLSASTLIGDRVVNQHGEDLGRIEEIMLDVTTGQVAYAVLSFGGLLSMGDKLFAIPWGVLELDADNKRFKMDVEKSTLEHAPGFDKDNWPKTTEHQWLADVYDFYGHKPYWK
jgi:sporulation protein YlmC with PRC-barrel domain